MVRTYAIIVSLVQTNDFRIIFNILKLIINNNSRLKSQITSIEKINRIVFFINHFIVFEFRKLTNGSPNGCDFSNNASYDLWELGN